MHLHPVVCVASLSLATLLLVSRSCPAQAAPQFRDRIESGLASRYLAAFDHEGDGDVDLLIGTAFNGVQVFTNDGVGGFARTGLPAGIVNSLSVGDVDGDGDLDAVATTDLHAVWIRNDGGLFTVRVVLAGVGPALSRLVDVDFDGDLDLVVYGPLVIPFVALNDGSGGFVRTPNVLPLPSLSPYTIDSVDLTGDGFEELMVFSQQGNYLLLGDPNGYIDVSQRLAGLPRIRSVLPLDADGDGHLDFVGVVVGAFPGIDTMRLFFGDGTGAFPRSAALPIGASGSAGMVACDLDEDGDLDLAVSNYSAQRPILLLLQNDGSGGFVDVTAQRYSLPTGNGLALAAADFDGDRDVDLYLGAAVFGIAAEDDRLLLNRHIDLLVDSTVAIGTDLRIACARQPGYGDPRSLGLALIAVGEEAVVPVATPFGSARLLPSAVSLPFVALPGPANAGVIFERVPSDPALVGLRFGLQALLLDVFGVVPPRLTGVQRGVVG